MLIDSHAHIGNRDFSQDLDAVLDRAQANGLAYIVDVGYDLPSSRRAVALAGKYPMVYAAVGIHPHDAAAVDAATYDHLRQLAKSEKVVAIGEMGLDYYRDLSPRFTQQEVFRRQIALARELRLPIIVHDRDAHADTVTILREERADEVGGVMHCFSGSWEMARQCLNLGFYISLAGTVTYKNAHRPQEIARLVPLDRLLIETDAPYLTPEPLRGKRNEPAYVRHTATLIAQLRKISVEQLAEATSANTRRLFGLPEAFLQRP